MAFDNGNNHVKKDLKQYYQKANKMEDYHMLLFSKGRVRALTKLAIYYQNVLKDINSARKYYLMAIEKGDVWAIDEIRQYYDHNVNDFSFMDYYNEYPDKFAHLLNSKFGNHVDLPKEFYQQFCNLKLLNNGQIHDNVKYKQYILKMTNIFPRNFSADGMIAFMELLSISRGNNNYLPKDIILKIAGHLFL